MLTITSNDAQLRTVNPATGTTASSVTITLPGQTVNWGTGLAQDPTTGTLWGLLRINNLGTTRQLVTINPSTGVATSVGNTGDNFAALAFNSSGTLFGLTGDGAAAPDSLFTLNKSTGAPTFVMALSTTSDDGEVLAYNTAAGVLYRGSGRLAHAFERVDPVTGTVTPVTLSGAGFTEFRALAERDANSFYLCDGSLTDANLYTLSTDGTVALVTPLDHTFVKGMVLVPVPEPGTLLAAGAAGLVAPGLLRRLKRGRGK